MPGPAFFVVMLAKIAVVFGLMLLSVAYLTWLERKVISDFQVRLGPMRVGPHGLLQPIADGIKLMFKEDIIPQAADRTIYVLAPTLALIPAFISFAVIPFGDRLQLFGQSIDMVITDVNIGLLYLFGVASLGVSESGENRRRSVKGLVHPASTDRFLDLPDLRDRRDQSCPLRSPGSRDRAGGRLPRGVQLHEVRHVLHG